MKTQVTQNRAKALVGKEIYAVKKDGTVVTGKLVQIKGRRLIIKPRHSKVTTKAFIPLVLYDLLAIGTYGGYGGFGGFGGYGGYPYTYGYPGYFL